jgi:plastocyanin
MAKRALTIAAALAVAALVLAACGGDDSSTTGSADASSSNTGTAAAETTSDDSASGSTGSAKGGTVAIEADPSGALAFTKTEIDAPAGTDTIEFSNPSSTGHNVEIEDSSGEDIAETDTITDGKTSATADLQPGTYTFYCAVPGHREAGMEGTITVK